MAKCAMMPLLGLDDDSLGQCAAFLAATEVEGLRACCARLGSAMASDRVWEVVARRRWSRRRQEAEWLEVMRARGGGWRAGYVAGERSLIRKRVPVFAMARELRLGQPLDLHFFEPRYRWLVRRALADHEGCFILCTQAPRPSKHSATFSWLCAAQDVRCVAGGRSNLVAMPLVRVTLLDAWHEIVPGEPRTPPLVVADAEEIAGRSAPAPSNLGPEDLALLTRFNNAANASYQARTAAMATSREKTTTTMTASNTEEDRHDQRRHTPPQSPSPTWCQVRQPAWAAEARPPRPPSPTRRRIRLRSWTSLAGEAQ